MLGDPFATGALALLAVGALLLMIGAGGVRPLIAFAAVLLVSGAGLAVVYLRQVLATAPAGGLLRGHRVAAWAALAGAAAACVVAPIVFWTDEPWAVTTAAVACACGLLSVPVALGARRRAHRADDPAGRCLAGLAVGASLVCLIVLAVLAIVAIGIATSFS